MGLLGIYTDLVFWGGEDAAYAEVVGLGKEGGKELDQSC